MNRNRLLQALIFCLAAGNAATAGAVLVEFQTGDLLMIDASSAGTAGGGLYTPSGTFVFDTDTHAVSAVNVSTPFGNYVSGVYDAGFEAFGLFTAADLSGPVLDITIDFAELQSAVAGLGAGDTFSLFFADPYEFHNVTLEDYGYGIDPYLWGTVLAATPVPAPAALPLLLSGLGGLSLAMRRRRKPTAA